MGKVKKIVTLHLDPVAVEIEIEESMSEKEMVTIAKNQMVKNMSAGKFPRLSYSVSDGDVLTFQTIKVGMIVIDKETDKTGIVIAINKKTVSVAFTGSIILNGPPECFKEAKVKNIDKIMWKRPEWQKDYFRKGDVGYFVAKTTSGVVMEKVVVTSDSRGKFHLTIINSGGSYYTVEESKLNRQLFDDKAKANELYVKLGGK